MYFLLLDFQVSETHDTGLKDRQNFRISAGNRNKELHVFNDIWTPTGKPHSNIFVLHRCWTQILQPKHNNNTPVTGTRCTCTEGSATKSLKFQWTQPKTGLTEPSQDHEKLFTSITDHQHLNWIALQECGRTDP